MRRAFALSLLVLACAPAAWAEQPASDIPVASATIEVTTTRIPEAVESEPATISVITGEELRDRGATDLPSALALVGGVSIAPAAGDAGPAGSVPEFYGLREADAFLLVVDGVPWGGAFNPALTTLDLTDVERIEVLRGAAPVMYGATSFVGVIHVIHRAAGAPGREVSAWGGSFGSGGAAASTPLPALGGYRQSLAVGFDRQGFRDDDTSWRRGHLLYRGAAQAWGGDLHLDLDGTFLRQDPASPMPRAGHVVPDPSVPLDSNQNPDDARADEDRLHLVTGFDRPLGAASWSTTLAVTRAARRNTRGFLGEVSEDVDPNASGFRQHLWETDVYFDSHLAWRPAATLQVVAGIDHIYGLGSVDSSNFDYFVRLDGSGRPASSAVDIQELNVTHDRRNFSGLFAQADWDATPRLKVELGARLNHTREEREAINHPLASGDEPLPPLHESKTVTRGGAIAGLSFLAWSNATDSLWLYADYRNTYKPAATDFGPEIEGILRPETGQSWEGGVKGNLDRGRFVWGVSAFTMDFQNVVVPADLAGLPGSVNAHEQRLRGAEAEAALRLRPDLRWQLSYAYHDARFRDFVQVFDGEPQQLAGNRVEMSARHLAASALTYTPAHGLGAWATVSYVGERYLNKRNTALAPAYTVWSAGIGYRFAAWELRLEGTNLGDTRPPIAESEFGDAQYYLLPARALRLAAAWKF
ncbi:MAG: TonB-dependent receptor [Acidobacteriota bacterium]